MGESTLVLEDNVDGDWAVGDNIVLASTDFFGDQSEFLTIASVSGNTVTTVESFGYHACPCRCRCRVAVAVAVAVRVVLGGCSSDLLVAHAFGLVS